MTARLSLVKATDRHLLAVFVARVRARVLREQSAERAAGIVRLAPKRRAR